MTQSNSLLVVGGGYFGRRLVEDVLERTSLRVILGARSPERGRGFVESLPDAHRARVAVAACDLSDARSVERSLDGAAAAVCAAGPYQGLPLTFLARCLKRGTPYLDLADDRDFVSRARAFVAEFGAGGLPAVGIGWSTAPALSGVLAKIAAEGFERVESIRVQIAPGNRNARGQATVGSLLASLGKRFRVRSNGAWREVRGGTETRTFRFPDPVGPREGFLVDTADHDLLPPLFGGADVEFRAGAELGVLNLAASSLSRLPAKGVERAAGVLTGALSLLSRFGTDAGAAGVEVEGVFQGQRAVRRACIVADREGERIAVLPAAIMAPRLAERKLETGGLLPLDSWATRQDLERECSARGFRLSVEESRG
ncbi:MAG: saccharopine dehydrogenase NADP-binding domain-containing protein [Elusimicrobia bacterium]|nr:saccharopine dehydrogenase NADP-binding domain-containing protein [Elusimicrobiota bacterium]